MFPYFPVSDPFAKMMRLDEWAEYADDEEDCPDCITCCCCCLLGEDDEDCCCCKNIRRLCACERVRQMRPLEPGVFVTMVISVAALSMMLCFFSVTVEFWKIMSRTFIPINLALCVNKPYLNSLKCWMLVVPQPYGEHTIPFRGSALHFYHVAPLDHIPPKDSGRHTPAA